MSDRIQLVGAEDVRSAGHTMRSAAETMSQAACNFDGSVERLKLFMDDWLSRFERVLEVDRVERRRRDRRYSRAGMIG